MVKTLLEMKTFWKKNQKKLEKKKKTTQKHKKNALNFPNF